MKEPTLKIYSAIVFSMVFWALSFVWYKQVLVFLNPVSLVLFRLIISSIILWIFTSLTGKLQKLKRRDIGSILLLSFFQPFLYFVGESYGMNYVSSTLGSVIISTIPLFTPIAAAYFLKEKLAFSNYLGLVLSFSGVAILILQNNKDLQINPIGIAFLLLSVFAAVAYGMILIKKASNYNTITLITYQNTFGIAWFLPMFIILDVPHLSAENFDSSMWLPLLQLAFFASSLAFIFFTYGIRQIGISRANIFTNLIPVFTAFFAWLILNETLTLTKMFAIGITISGLFLSQIKFKPHAKTTLSSQ